MVSNYRTRRGLNIPYAKGAKGAKDSQKTRKRQSRKFGSQSFDVFFRGLRVIFAFFAYGCPLHRRNTRPGFNRFCGSSDFLMERIRAKATGDLCCSSLSRFIVPTPCSAEIEPS